MNIAQIENNLQQIIQAFNKETFIYDLLLAYGLPKASISKLKIGNMNLSKTEGEIIWKKKLFFRSVENADVHEVITSIMGDESNLRHEPRFIIVTDFETLLAVDTKTSDTLDITVLNLPKHYDFFLPWAGMEKAVHQNENPADVRAAERMAKLYDEINKDNPTKTPEEVHNQNVFLSRLLFCFFAEDTGIFKKSQFTHAINNHTQTDGSDLNTYLDTLFEVMNTSTKQRIVSRAELPAYLNAFPYVNGGLFRNSHSAPVFTRRSRQMLIESGDLDWSSINPDIFGSMIQAVITPEHRGGLGMHYTSVPNIMKVIEPLFLNELKEEFDAGKGNVKKLTDLLKRIWNIKIFDPACGSGNFLIIAYKELRRLEMRIYKELDVLRGNLGSGKLDFGDSSFSKISLNHFYGIELDDFAHEVATLSLWLAEHQMNQEFFQEFGRAKPALPLIETGKILHGNATRLDWEVVCPKLPNDEICILGNPPYLGARVLDEVQKNDMKEVFSGKVEGYNDLDYIACWFYKGSEYIKNFKAQCAFVSTNSICQGSQVPNLWPSILKESIEISFVYQSFKWTNNAKSNAAVIVVILGIRNISSTKKYIFKDGHQTQVKNISPYLISSDNIYVTGRRSSLAQLQPMSFGSMPNDGGNLTFDANDYHSTIAKYPASEKFFKKLLGSKEFINDIPRWCLWIEESELEEALQFDFIRSRLEKVKQHRSASDRTATAALSNIPYRFAEVRFKPTSSIIVPKVSSERRQYIPIGFIESDSVVTDLAFAVYDAPLWLFSALTSNMHMTWVRTIGGRLKMDYRYSTALCYNTFPFPSIYEAQKQELEKQVYRILEEREAHSEKTLAQLYDPDKMPAGLREAHRQNDLAVERCYRTKPFESDEERLEFLFKLYEQMIAAEKDKGTLFEKEKKSKKIK